jgi:hypothetical protein
MRGEGFATDASVIKADAQRQRGKPGKETIKRGTSLSTTMAPLGGPASPLMKRTIVISARRVNT